MMSDQFSGQCFNESCFNSISVFLWSYKCFQQILHFSIWFCSMNNQIYSDMSPFNHFIPRRNIDLQIMCIIILLHSNSLSQISYFHFTKRIHTNMYKNHLITKYIYWFHLFKNIVAFILWNPSAKPRPCVCKYNDNFIKWELTL